MPRRPRPTSLEDRGCSVVAAVVTTDALKQLSPSRHRPIVTTRDGDRIHGMTVTAYTEVSLEPPLVLVCADQSSNTHPVIAAGGVFALNLLADAQAELSNRFASKQDEDRRFEGSRGRPR